MLLKGRQKQVLLEKWVEGWKWVEKQGKARNSKQQRKVGSEMAESLPGARKRKFS
jgi:hypothetical protein